MRIVVLIPLILRHFVFAIALCALTSPVWADYQAGYDAYQRGDYPTCIASRLPTDNE